jgi:hypothetical protein
MPRFIVTPSPPSPKHDAFVKKLVQEFAATSTNVQPLILEERIRATGSRHVRVIWDRWKEIADEERGAIILDAYTQAEGSDAAGEVTIADGVTPREALALGLLPYKVVPVRKKNDPLKPEAYQAALSEEAGQTLLGAKGRELRYARLEDAEEALRRLQAALPRSSWAVVQEIATES